MQQRNNGYVQVYSLIISGNIGNAGGLNAALNQPKEAGYTAMILYRKAYYNTTEHKKPAGTLHSDG